MPAARFSRKGVMKAYFVPTITTPAAPTVAEITAGTNLTPQIAEISGFEFTNSPVATPDVANTFTPQVTGEDTAADSSITFWELKGGTDTIHDAQAKGTVGYVVLFAVGIAGATPAASDKCEVWPVTIGSNARRYSADNVGAQYVVSYSITSAPTQVATVAA